MRRLCGWLVDLTLMDIVGLWLVLLVCFQLLYAHAVQIHAKLTMESISVSPQDHPVSVQVGKCVNALCWNGIALVPAC